MTGAADLHQPGSRDARAVRRIAQNPVLLLAALVIVHLVAALRHHFMKHNNVLRRMWFG